MDTTISDLARFFAALTRHEGISAASQAQMLKPQLHIGTATQFPNFAPDQSAARQRKDLNAGLGVVLFRGPQGAGLFKGGHDGQTANMLVCLRALKGLRPTDVQRRSGGSRLLRIGRFLTRQNRRPA
jgi:hypothetical protein